MFIQLITNNYRYIFLQLVKADKYIFKNSIKNCKINSPGVQYDWLY